MRSGNNTEILDVVVSSTCAFSILPRPGLITRKPCVTRADSSLFSGYAGSASNASITISAMG